MLIYILMNTFSADTPSDITARFAHIESTYEYRRLESAETIDVRELPVFIRLGQSALHTFAIISATTHLTSSERSSELARGGRGVYLNPDIDTLIVDPATYNINEERGYKAIRDGSFVRLGRSHQDDLPRFDDFSMNVSKDHAVITKSFDGKTITVRDLQSTNGTFIGRPVVYAGETESFEDQPVTTVETKPFVVRSVSFLSRASERHLERNEDSILVDETNNMYAVFDGVGGHEGGDIASKEARNYTSRQAIGAKGFDNLNDAEDYLRDILIGANKNILKRTSEAATTAVITKLHEINGELFASIAHTGDSRAYLLRNGVLKALTADHTPFRREGYTEEAMKQQEVLADTDNMSVLSPEEVAMFNRRNIIGACLGRDNNIIADVQHVAIKQGDAIILTSDGVHDNLKTEEMQDLLNDTNSSERARTLTNAAHNRSRETHVRAKADDISAIVVNI